MQTIDRERWLCVAVDASEDGILMCDREWRVICANPAAERLFERAGEAMTGMEALAAADHRGNVDALRARVDGGERVTIETVRVRRDGTPLELSLTLAAVVAGEERLGLSVVVRDIGPRKRLEAQLRHAERLTAVGVVAAGVAHDLANPLSYLLLGVSALKREVRELSLPPTKTVTLRTQLDAIEHGAQYIHGVARAMRSLSLSTDELLQPIDLADALEGAVALAAAEIRTRAALRVRIESLPAVVGNPTRAIQMFLNVLLNAAQAIEEGASDANVVDVWARTEAGAKSVIVEIRDTGVGADEATRLRMFDRFFSTKAAAGMGLGLAIVRDIATSMNGTIEVRTAPGEGAVFRFTLPASA